MSDLKTSMQGSMSQSLVDNYKRLNKKYAPPKPRQTKKYFEKPKKTGIKNKTK